MASPARDFGIEDGGAFTLHERIHIGEKGRIVIPIEMREALGMKEGELLDLRVVDGELRIATRRARIRRAQERARRYIPQGVLLSEELSAERREEARREALE